MGDPKRIALLAADLVAHFEKRVEAMDGKAMVVCMSRRTCVELYKAIQKLPPAWHHDDDDKDTMKIVMSGSRIMSRIRSRGNAATELRLIEIFRAHKITGWRRNQKLLGKPDFVFRAKRLVVFVDGCFWHGCPRCYRRPLSNLKYWDAKVLRNRQRDKTVKNTLQKLGGRVVRIGAHELKKPARCLRKFHPFA